MEQDQDQPKPEQTNSTGLYRLEEAIRHIGGNSGGHFVADIMDPSTNQWTNFDDSTMKDENDSEVIKNLSNAYMLFYVHEPGIQKRGDLDEKKIEEE